MIAKLIGALRSKPEAPIDSDQKRPVIQKRVGRQRRWYQSPARVPWNRSRIIRFPIDRFAIAETGSAQAPRRLLIRLPSRSLGRRIIGPNPSLEPKHIWAIQTRLQHDGHVRDLALFNVAIDSKLRGCDLVKLHVSDVHLGEGARLRTTIVQRNGGRPVPFEMIEPTRDALSAWLKKRGSRSSDWLFPSRSHAGDHITTRQHGRLVDDWVTLAGLDPAHYGTHSLRRTKVALLSKRTGDLRACQLLLCHSKLESTVRYLGVEIDDALILSEQTDL